MLENVLNRIRNLPKQTEESLNDALGLIVQIKDSKVLLEWVRWVRREAMALRTAEALTIVRKTYMLGGRHNFDDFMIAMEWDREPKARFWLPRRKVLEGKHKIATRIQEFLEDETALYLGFSQPPGTGKSTLIKFLLSYIAGTDPKSANIYCSYSDGMVKLMLDSVKAMLTDPEYCFHEIFPGLGEPDISAEYKTVSYRRKGDFPTIGLISLGGSVTGRTRANNLMISDDLVKNKEEARSPERLEKLYGDYKATLTTRMIGNAKQIQLGTIWSAYDPISRMRDEHGDDPRYTFIAIPVWDENEVSNFEFDHPDRYTTEKIRDIKNTIDPADFECLFMQHGIEKEGLAFPSDGLQYYNGVLPEIEPDNIIFFCDVAFGGGDSLSMPIGYVYGDSLYVVDVVFDKRSKDVTQPRVVGKIMQHKIKMGRFEGNNGGDFFCDDVSGMLKEHGYHCNLSHKKAPTTMSKMSRIEQYSPEIRKVYFLTESKRDDDYRRFMNELTSFSFTTKNLHDDAPDSMAGLCAYVTTGIKSVTVGRRPF